MFDSYRQLLSHYSKLSFDEYSIDKLVSDAEQFDKSDFAIDDLIAYSDFHNYRICELEPVFTGVCTDEIIDGFECPLFTFDEAKKIADFITSCDFLDTTFEYDTTKFIEYENGNIVDEITQESFNGIANLFRIGSGYLWVDTDWS